MPERDTLALIEKARGGCGKAFEELLAPYQDKVFNSIYRMVGNYDDALDLAQVTFIKAFQGVDKFKGASKIYTWLYRIAVNTVLSERRKKATLRGAKIISLDRVGSHEAATLSRSLPSKEEGPDERAVRRERSEAVGVAIASLDEDYRVVVVLKDIDGLPYEEIAEIVGCPRGTVKSRLHRARTLLKEKLKDLI